IEGSENTVRRHHGRLQHVVLVGDIANRLKQKSGILNESDQCSQCQYCVARRFLHYPITAIPDDQSNSYRTNEIHKGKENSVVKDRFNVCPSVVGVYLIEFTQ